MKIVLVLAVSITLFCIHSWWGIALLALLVGLCALCARLRFAQVFKTFLPLAFILLFTVVCNAVDFGTGTLSADGFARGCYYVLRIVILLLASLVLTTTSSSTEITQAIESFLKPLGRVGVPVHDIATIVSIALRFIPVTIDEFNIVRCAHTARGASFGAGGIVARIKAWAGVLIPLFVGLYRRAENLSIALDARCYGNGPTTRLVSQSIDLKQIALLIAGLVMCFLLVFFA